MSRFSVHVPNTIFKNSWLNKNVNYKECAYCWCMCIWWCVWIELERPNWGAIESDVLYIYAHGYGNRQNSMCCLFDSSSSYAVVINVVVHSFFFLFIASCTNAWRITMPCSLFSFSKLESFLLPSILTSVFIL